MCNIRPTAYKYRITLELTMWETYFVKSLGAYYWKVWVELNVSIFDWIDNNFCTLLPYSGFNHSINVWIVLRYFVSYALITSDYFLPFPHLSVNYQSDDQRLWFITEFRRSSHVGLSVGTDCLSWFFRFMAQWQHTFFLIILWQSRPPVCLAE